MASVWKVERLEINFSSAYAVSVVLQLHVPHYYGLGRAYRISSQCSAAIARDFQTLQVVSSSRRRL